MRGRDETLEFPKIQVEGEAKVPSFSFAVSKFNISMLLVAGNESLPDGQPNPWNKRKSKEMLTKYLQPCSDSEGEDEKGESSRKKRLRLAQFFGLQGCS
jgi:hypothetical protein